MYSPYYVLDEDDWVLLDLLEMENKTESLESQLALSEEDGELRFNVLCKFLADGYNHKVCAIRCIFKGKRGGKCTEDGVCSCCK